MIDERMLFTAAGPIRSGTTRHGLKCYSQGQEPDAQVRGVSLSAPSLQRGPNIPSKPRVVRFVVHIVRKSDGTGNYLSHADAVAAMTQTFDWVNQHWMSNLYHDSLPTRTDFVQDLAIRWRLVDVVFHDDDALWQHAQDPFPAVCDSTWWNAIRVNARKHFNIFLIGRLSPQGGGGCAPSPYFFNFFGSATPATGATWAQSQLFAHEMGHSFGLYHTYFADAIADTPPEKVAAWIPPDSLKTSNNLMGGNYSRTTLRRQQLEIIHASLRSVASSMRDIVLAPPTPRALVRDFEGGLCGVDEWGDNTGDLVRAFWTPDAGPAEPARWNLETVAHRDFRAIPGSLISTESVTPARVYGVTDRYEVFRTEPAGGNPTVHSLGAMTVQPINAAGAPSIAPGSLCDGVTPNVLYAVDHNRRIVRFIVGTTSSTWTSIGGPFISAGSLVQTEWNSTVRIFAVTDQYFVVYLTGNGTSTTSMAGVTAVPGSLISAGALGLFGIKENGNLVHIDTSLTASIVNVTGVIADGLHGGSLVWQSEYDEVYGVTPAGRTVRLVDSAGTVNPTVLPAVIPDVVPGSLVDGLGNGLIGVTPAGDLVNIFSPLPNTWTWQLIAPTGGQVLPGSLLSDPGPAVDNGRAYGVNVNGQIIGTWGAGPAMQYSIIE